MTIPERIRAGLDSPDPIETLSQLVLALSAEGHTKVEIYKIFLEASSQMGAQGRTREEEILEGVLEALTGWCSYKYHLLPDEKIPSRTCSVKGVGPRGTGRGHFGGDVAGRSAGQRGPVIRPPGVREVRPGSGS
ncbi:MAG TPA: hypothetical protein VF590_06980 [Isosphaeraceae bacterium]|jgi:hypothetical protein